MYYVYELIDPRNGLPFYVGKGCGGRVHEHERFAKRGDRAPRYQRIREIWADGHKVGHRVVRRFRNEDRAYEYEAAHIAKIGLEKLTNVAPGGRMNVGDPEDMRDREAARSLLVIAWKTNNFTEKRRWWFGQKWHDLPNSFLPTMAQHLVALVAKRGPDWLASVPA